MTAMPFLPQARNRTGEETIAPLLGDVTVMLTVSPDAVGGGNGGGAEVPEGGAGV